MLKRPSVEASFHKLSILLASSRRALGERKPSLGHVDEKRLMFRSAGRLRQSNALRLRNWPKLGKFASISMHMGTDRAFCQKNTTTRNAARERRPLGAGDREEHLARRALPVRSRRRRFQRLSGLARPQNGSTWPTCARRSPARAAVRAAGRQGDNSE